MSGGFGVCSIYELSLNSMPHNGYGLGDVAVFENRQPVTAAQ